jgi:hypothetical protein
MVELDPGPRIGRDALAARIGTTVEVPSEISALL